MAKWKESLNKITGKNETERAAAFEAAAMAELSHANPTQPTPSATHSPHPPTPSSASSITITTTENGTTVTYHDLASVPLELRQRIVSAWLSKPIP